MNNTKQNQNKLDNITTGNHTIKIVGSETFEKTITVYKNKTATITAKSRIAPTPNDLPDRFTDQRDGKVYKMVTIGTQTWFAENLAYTGNNGHQRHITDNDEWVNNNKYDGWCYYNNDASKGKKYGILYQWEAAKNACPSGWHLPTDAEWKELEMELGMSKSDADDTGWRGDPVGKKLKSTSGWDSNGNGNNESGFTALPGGWRYYYDGSFDYAGAYAHFWSSTPYESECAWERYLWYDPGKVNRNRNNRKNGHSVRCLQDWYFLRLF